MPRITSIAFLVVGVILLVYGLNASDSFGSSINRAVNGAPSDKAIWLIAGGVLGIISGAFGIFFRRSP
jgi:hypothetical protein